MKSWEDVYKYNVGLKELTKLPVVGVLTVHGWFAEKVY